jgi:heme/copper-type cytochrome/quinol oxidase subunit 2
VWYFLTAIGIIVLVVGAYMSYKVMEKQRHKEFEKRLPDHVVSHPVSHNSTLIWYVLTPIAALILGIIAWMVFEG